MKKHNGFTLIELVTVLIVIGVLASMMIFASSEAISTAKASNIVSNLRNFSMAAMALYTDSIDDYIKPPSNVEDLTGPTKRYLHDELDMPTKGGGEYRVKRDTGNNWWAGYELSAADNERVKEKLSGRAESAKLRGSDNENPPEDNSKYAKHKSVWLLIRSDKKK